MFTFKELIEQVLEEENVAGGAGSAFGPGVEATATQFSGDNYARGRADRPFALGKGVVIKRNKIPTTIFTGKKRVRKKRKSNGYRALAVNGRSNNKRRYVRFYIRNTKQC